MKTLDETILELGTETECEVYAIDRGEKSAKIFGKVVVPQFEIDLFAARLRVQVSCGMATQDLLDAFEKTFPTANAGVFTEA